MRWALVVVTRDDGDLAVWPLPWPGHDNAPPDLSAVDAVARLQLAARRQGCSIRLRDPCPELRELLDLVGLTDVVVE